MLSVAKETSPSEEDLGRWKISTFLEWIGRIQATIFVWRNIFTRLKKNRFGLKRGIMKHCRSFLTYFNPAFLFNIPK